MELKKKKLIPGQQVSVDHFQSALPGRLYNSKGRTAAKDMFHGGCIFVDNSSGYIQVRHQVTFNAGETVKAKLFYKRDMSSYGVCIQEYHTDNGLFTFKDFMDALIEKYQHIRFSGAGDDNQNGVTKRGIQTVFRMARNMMIHSATRIPKGTITAELWPMAIDHAVWVYKKMHCKDYGLSTYGIWSLSSFLHRKKIMST